MGWWWLLHSALLVASRHLSSCSATVAVTLVKYIAPAGCLCACITFMHASCASSSQETPPLWGCEYVEDFKSLIDGFTGRHVHLGTLLLPSSLHTKQSVLSTAEAGGRLTFHRCQSLTSWSTVSRQNCLNCVLSAINRAGRDGCCSEALHQGLAYEFLDQSTRTCLGCRLCRP